MTRSDYSQRSTPLLLTVAAALWALYGTLLGSLGAAAKWSFTGRLEPHAGFPMYDSLSFRRALVLISEIPLGMPLLQCLPTPDTSVWQAAQTQQEDAALLFVCSQTWGCGVCQEHRGAPAQSGISAGA